MPTGLDRVTFKAEEHIKSVSGVNDSMQGFDREDVAARAIEKKRQAGATSTLSKPLDNLTRSDFYLARGILGLVQRFYTEPRILTITGDDMTGEAEEVAINQPSETGEILNDLTIGEYDVVITSVPHRETMEDYGDDLALTDDEAGAGAGTDDDDAGEGAGKDSAGEGSKDEPGEGLRDAADPAVDGDDKGAKDTGTPKTGKGKFIPLAL
ncbi:hypothetical protein [Comamonas aquatica]|uniref:portal protein n=1 Tax=Comamonas aquatica TaxID=225991 RepID=UPI0024493573|nr:hypothetical protein [Comamonas aquatica]MDH0200707.1 hypothetical protein [Comamonas aquatica]MDH1445579.1 hypothetical protein [Comamonas aquatica]